MLEPIGRYEFVIDAYLTDFRGKATLPMIGGFMLQCATKHAEERGFGYSYMTANDRIWVLSRMAIELYEYPKNDSIFVVKTWVATVNRLFTERCFAFEDGEGRKIGFARSLWASINIKTRKPTNILDLNNMVSLMDSETPCPVENFGKIPSLKEESEQVGKFRIKYSDIDINKHLNSMKYIEHFVDVFDINLFRDKDITRFDINYISEGQYGTTINIKQKKVDNFTYLLEMADDASPICSAKVIWK